MSIKLLIVGLIGVSGLCHAQSYAVATFAGVNGIKDGIPAKEAMLRQPSSVVQDAQGRIFVSDTEDHRIRMIGTNGFITTIAGTGEPGFDGDNKPAKETRLNRPFQLALDAAGNFLYFVDRANYRVRRIQLATGAITTIAGNGNSQVSGNGGPATSAGMAPHDIALDPAGTWLYIAEYQNHRVRRVNLATGTISAFAGDGSTGFTPFAGAAQSVPIAFPASLAADANFVYVAQSSEGAFSSANRLHRIDVRTNQLEWFMGSGSPFPLTETDLNPAFQRIGSVRFNSEGNLVVMDYSRIRLISIASRTIRTIIGGFYNLGFSGDGDEVDPARVSFTLPNCAISPRAGEYLIADTGNFRVRRISGLNVRTIAGISAVDGLLAPATVFSRPRALSSDRLGNLFVEDYGHGRVRQIAITGIVTSLASGPRQFMEARPTSGFGAGLTTDSENRLYTTSGSHVFRWDRSGVIEHLAGMSSFDPTFAGDGGQAEKAVLNEPRGLAVDRNGNLYIADTGNRRVRRVTASDNIINTVVGNGQAGTSGDGGPAVRAGLVPSFLAFDSLGNLYISDEVNGRVRKVDLATGIITTVAGTEPGYAGDGGPANQAQLRTPRGIALDAQGNLYICDPGNMNVRRVDAASGIIRTIAGSGSGASETGLATNIRMRPEDVLVEAGGRLLITDSWNDRIRRLTPLVPRTLEVVAKDQPTVDTSSRADASVRVLDAAGLPIQGVTVRFSVVSGDVRLVSTTGTTDLAGVARVQMAIGEIPGVLTVRATADGLGEVLLVVTSVKPAGTAVPPVVTSLNSLPGSVPRQTVLASLGLAVVEGMDLSPNQAEKIVQTGDLDSGGRLPVNVSGSCVEIGGVKAPLLAVSKTRIVLQVPELPAAGEQSVRVISGCGTTGELSSEVRMAQFQPVAPEFFYVDRNADGSGTVAIIRADSGEVASFAQPGENVILYLTGMGQVDPRIDAGVVVTGNSLVQGTVRLQIDQRLIDSIAYSGSTAELPPLIGDGYRIAQNAGVYQILFQVPDDVQSGRVPIQISVNGVVSPATAMIDIRRDP